MSLEYLESLGYLLLSFPTAQRYSLVTIREPRRFEDRAEVAVAHRCKASVIATCLPNASAKIHINPFFVGEFHHLLLFIAIFFSPQSVSLSPRSNRTVFQSLHIIPSQAFLCLTVHRSIFVQPYFFVLDLSYFLAFNLSPHRLIAFSPYTLHHGAPAYTAE